MPKTSHSPQKGFEKSLYHHHILAAKKLANINSTESKLDGTNNVIKVRKGD